PNQRLDRLTTHAFGWMPEPSPYTLDPFCWNPCECSHRVVSPARISRELDQSIDRLRPSVARAHRETRETNHRCIGHLCTGIGLSSPTQSRLSAGATAHRECRDRGQAPGSI